MAGRNEQAPVVDISLKNNSSKDLDWVELEWSGPGVPGGVIGPGISKTSIGVEWPNLPSATVSFVDRKTRKPYRIELSLTGSNAQIRQGKCRHVIIQILDYDRADVVCE